MTFARVKEAMKRAYRAASPDEELYAFDGLCELLIIEREIFEAEHCLRHQGVSRRIPERQCVGCMAERKAA